MFMDYGRVVQTMPYFYNCLFLQESNFIFYITKSNNINLHNLKNTFYLYCDVNLVFL